jgi:hypothetical protein
MSNSVKPTLLAIHESGHTVLSLWAGLVVDRVSVLSRGDERGSCHVRMAGATPGIAAAVMLAGYLAAKIANPYIAMTTSDSDFERAAKMLPDGANLEDLIFKVNRRLIALWPSVLRVAKVLDYHGEIVGVELIRAVAGLPYLLSKGD